MLDAIARNDAIYVIYNRVDWIYHQKVINECIDGAVRRIELLRAANSNISRLQVPYMPIYTYCNTKNTIEMEKKNIVYSR